MTWTTREIATITEAAARHGAEVDYQRGASFVNVDVPAGSVWASNGAHTLVLDGVPETGRAACHSETTARGRRAAIADGLERIAAGLRPCDDANCEHCNP